MKFMAAPDELACFAVLLRPHMLDFLDRQHKHIMKRTTFLKKRIAECKVLTSISPTVERKAKAGPVLRWKRGYKNVIGKGIELNKAGTDTPLMMETRCAQSRAVLCCAVLCCAVLCCAVLCCAVLCCAVL